MTSFFSPTNIKNEIKKNKEKKNRKIFYQNCKKKCNKKKISIANAYEKKMCGKCKNPTVCVNQDRKKTIKKNTKKQNEEKRKEICKLLLSIKLTKVEENRKV